MIDQHLFLSTAISKANPPNRHNLKFFREWFERADMGNQPLLDDDKLVWNGEHDKDLIALGQPPGEDVVSRWFIDNMIPLLHRKFRSGVSVGRNSQSQDKILNHHIATRFRSGGITILVLLRSPPPSLHQYPEHRYFVTLPCSRNGCFILRPQHTRTAVCNCCVYFDICILPRLNHRRTKN